MEKAACFNCFG